MFLPKIGTALVAWEPDRARVIADFHTLFNIVTGLLFLPFLGPFLRLLTRMLPTRAAPTDPSRPLYLDEAARETPAIALAGAAREALRMADVVEAMLRGALEALDGDRKQVAAVKGLDTVVDRLNGAIKGYLTALDPEELDEEDNCIATIIEAKSATITKQPMGELVAASWLMSSPEPPEAVA